MNDKVLLVDDDPNILEGFKRGLRKQFHIATTDDGEQGLDAVSQQGPFAVIVSDLQMPGMDGIQFLAKVRHHAPDSVRMMLTGQADLEAAIEAVNEGNIFRFMTKPCPPEILAKMLEAGVEQYRLVTAERELLEKTLSGSVKVLTDIISLLSPVAFGRASRVRRTMVKLADQMSVDEPWKFELGGMLSQTGCVTMPAETVEKAYRGDPVTMLEQQMFNQHPQIGRDLIANIPRLESIAEIIVYQNKHYDGNGMPDDGREGKDIPLGARALHVALDFDSLVSSGKQPPRALEEIKWRGGSYDPTIVEALAVVIKREPRDEPRSLGILEMVSGMILNEDVYTSTGLLVIAKGQEVTPSIKARLENFNRTMGVKEPIRVLMPARQSKGSPQ